ncbi:MAG: hypothetical protein Q9160_003367 [Pyrenula sp. 1 TL-2023]
MVKLKNDDPADEHDSTDSDNFKEIPLTTARPETPQPPFEQFSYQTTHQAIKDGVSSDADISPKFLMHACDKLGPEGQQYWEAQYGRQMLRYQEALESWEREPPQPRATSDPEQELRHRNSSHVGTEVSLGAFDEFVEKFRCSLLGVIPEQKVSQVGDANHQTELYRLRDRLHPRTGRMQFINHSADEDTGDAIFEVTTFFHAPGLPRKRRWNGIVDPSSSESDIIIRPGPARPGRYNPPVRYDPDKAIAVGAEAGMILTINSEVIIEAMHSVAPGYPGLVFDGDSLIVAEPFCVLLQFRKEMLEYRDSLSRSEYRVNIGQDKQTEKRKQDLKAEPRSIMSSKLSTEPFRLQRAKHITQIYKFLDQKYLAAMSAEQQRWRQTEPVCTFEWSWLLFAPSTLVYEKTTNSNELPRAFLVESFSLRGLFNRDLHSKKSTVKPSRLDTRRKLKFRHRLRKITVSLTYLRNDGRKWIPGRRTIDILPFNGERLITNLPVYPVDESDNGSDSSLDWDIKVANILGRKDQANFIENTPLRKQPLTQLLRNPNPDNSKISDDIYLICDREITDCSFQEAMIEDLQVSGETKRLIQALSQNYGTRGSLAHDNDSGAARDELSPSSTWSSDFIPNKGRGQVLLLHRKPGVGKTTAAECVAELTKRPLISITCGDLGTSSWAVEQELGRWLRLGALWKGLLLFDEADIFLESRQQGDIERNSLVSVFLRALEYYQGLIFLTTNRIGTFDEAVISRVHVVLHFPDLTDKDRAQIWDTSFRKLGKERPDVKVDFSIYDFAYRDETIRSLKWNGREIRNAFNTMVALAEWDEREKGKQSKDGKIEIRREHLQQVARLSSDFKEYLQSLRGLDEALHAKLQGLRDDIFNNSNRG